MLFVFECKSGGKNRGKQRTAASGPLENDIFSLQKKRGGWRAERADVMSQSVFWEKEDKWKDRNKKLSVCDTREECGKDASLG